MPSEKSRSCQNFISLAFQTAASSASANSTLKPCNGLEALIGKLIDVILIVGNPTPLVFANYTPKPPRKRFRAATLLSAANLPGMERSVNHLQVGLCAADAASNVALCAVVDFIPNAGRPNRCHLVARGELHTGDGRGPFAIVTHHPFMWLSIANE
jgi:hypothetical protein